VERHIELEDVREALELLRARQTDEPLNDAQQRLYDDLGERERELEHAIALETVGAA
jgi:FixJ family two-component response regulator